MALILLGTVLSGVIFSKILLAAGLHHVISRFVIVLVLAYVSFFILMKLWLLSLLSKIIKKTVPTGKDCRWLWSHEPFSLD